MAFRSTEGGIMSMMRGGQEGKEGFKKQHKLRIAYLYRSSLIPSCVYVLLLAFFRLFI